MSKPIAYFDMDGSLFNYDKAMNDALEEMRGPDEEDYSNKNFHELEHIPHMNARMKRIKNTPGWWYNLEPIELGFAAYNKAKEIGFDCQILTKGPKQHPQSFAEKLRCCQHYFGERVNIHIVQNKGLIYGDVLYDDFPPYMKAWIERNPTGLGILPTSRASKIGAFKHNRVIECTEGYEHTAKVIAHALQVHYDNIKK